MVKTAQTRFVVVLFAAVVLALVLRYFVFASRAVPVAVHTVERGRVEETVSNSKAGTVKSYRQAALSPESGGRLQELCVKKGERVRKGQVLLRLASDDLSAQVTLRERSVDTARAAEREACTGARLAEQEYERARNLSRDSIVSVSILDQALAQRDSARAACEAAGTRIGEAQAALEAARVAFSRSVLRAPFDAVVAEISAEEGEWISPSPPALPIPPILQLFDPNALYVSCPLDEIDVGRVRTGQTVRVTFDAFPDKTFPGSIARVAPYVVDRVEQNRTFEIEVVLSDSAFSRTLAPGTSADVEVVLARVENALRFPRNALIEGKRVLVLTGGLLESRPVNPGLMNWEWVEARGGLAAGEQVVVSLDRPEVKAGARARAETGKHQ